MLGTIAQRYGVTVAALCRLNTIRSTDVIRPGQRLEIPGRAGRSEYAVKPPPPGASWAPFMKPAWRLGYVTLTGHGRSWKGYVVGPNDRVLPLARMRVTAALASWRTGKAFDVDQRLLRLIAHVSDVFGGRSIRLVGGYRERSYARHSRHKTGEAIDFSIPGVPNDVLRDYLRTHKDVGVGYYPNSTHVHLDVREKNSYWVDHSRPGRKPAYVLGGGSRTSQAVASRSRQVR
jgi:LysM repeat protein